MHVVNPRRLIARQFPQWAHLPVSQVKSAGTDNAIWRLGPELCVRMPRAVWAAHAVARECAFLPRFSSLPLATPRIVARGEPVADYPHIWSVCEWIEGDIASLDSLRDPVEAAKRLAGFVKALRSHDPQGGPIPSSDNNLRGGPLRGRDKRTREAIANLSSAIDTDQALAVWDEALGQAPYSGPGLWLHGDLKEDNLLAQDGELCAVIDFGMLAVGDPAVDLMPAWSLFEGPSREAYIGALATSPAELSRAKGWALSVAAIAWDHYRELNPGLSLISRRTLLRLC